MKQLLLCTGILSATYAFTQNTFPATGNVGIGTINPQASLEVNGNTILGKATEGSSVIVNDIPGARYRIATGGYNLSFEQHNAHTSQFEKRLTIANGGNVGIGTGTPQASLHILNNNNTQSILLQSSSAGWGSGMVFNNTAPQGKSYGIYSGAYGSLNFADNNIGVDRISINAIGNVGIGSSSPGGKLQVSDGADDPIKYGSLQIVRSSAPTDNHFHLSFIRNGQSVSGMGYVPNSNTLGIWHANNNTGSPLIAFTPDQKVGIGTTDPKGYKLAVNGEAIFTRAKVKQYGSWPDYVFAPDYYLRPLKEVEQFIKQHKHLPEVPSAKDIAESDGIDMGDNQALLLKKIEELTLYIIEQNKKLEEQQKRIEALETIIQTDK